MWSEGQDSHLLKYWVKSVDDKGPQVHDDDPPLNFENSSLAYYQAINGN